MEGSLSFEKSTGLVSVLREAEIPPLPLFLLSPCACFSTAREENFSEPRDGSDSASASAQQQCQSYCALNAAPGQDGTNSFPSGKLK